MQALTPISPFSDLRTKPKQILAKLKESPVVLTLRGRPSAVLIDYNTYNAMVTQNQARDEMLELLDEWLLQRASEQATGYQSLDALLQQHEDLFGEKIADRV